MVDHVSRSMNKHGRFIRRLPALASLLAGTMLSSTLPAAPPAAAGSVRIDTRQASGEPGDAILDTARAVGPASAAPPGRDRAPKDFLDGLSLDADREAIPDAAAGSGSGMQLRRRIGPAAAGAADAMAGSSPVYLDAAGNPRALPGGVIVTFREPLDAAAARAAIEASGHVALREIGPRMWVVETDSGDAALETARRLAADDRFESAEPNWWRAPVRK